MNQRRRFSPIYFYFLVATTAATIITFVAWVGVKLIQAGWTWAGVFWFVWSFLFIYELVAEDRRGEKIGKRAAEPTRDNPPT